LYSKSSNSSCDFSTAFYGVTNDGGKYSVRQGKMRQKNENSFLKALLTGLFMFFNIKQQKLADFNNHRPPGIPPTHGLAGLWSDLT
jgi:hypothetical protein